MAKKQRAENCVLLQPPSFGLHFSPEKIDEEVAKKQMTLLPPHRYPHYYPLLVLLFPLKREQRVEVPSPGLV